MSRTLTATTATLALLLSFIPQLSMALESNKSAAEVKSAAENAKAANAAGEETLTHNAMLIQQAETALRNAQESQKGHADGHTEQAIKYLQSAIEAAKRGQSEVVAATKAAAEARAQFEEFGK